MIVVSVPVSLVPRPHPVRILYRFQYNARELKAIRAGVGFGSGTETSVPVYYCSESTVYVGSNGINN